MFMFFSAKGGSGTTVTAASSALALANAHGRAVLVDLCGDGPAALGAAEPVGPGLSEWLAGASRAGAQDLMLTATSITDSLMLLHRGAAPIGDDARWADLARALTEIPSPVVVDLGTMHPPALLDVAVETLLVIRPCYLALRRALTCPRPTGVVVLHEPGRALSARDIESVLSVPVVAEIGVEPAVARAVDAGLLSTRMAQLIGAQLPVLETR